MTTDAATATFTCAANCALYIDDPGPARLNVGTETEPRMVPRAQAWEGFYARELLVKFDAHADQLREAVVASRAAYRSARTPAFLWSAYRTRRRHGHAPREAARKLLNPREHVKLLRVKRLALTLAEHALQMVVDAGAVDDESARQRLLVTMDHARQKEILGPLLSPEHFAEQARDVAEQLDDLDRGQAEEQQLPDSAREELDRLGGYHFIPENKGARRDLEPTADLVAAAAWLVIWTQFGSASMLSRRLGLTFSSVGKLLHELQRWDVLGPKPDGSMQHPVLPAQDTAYEVHKQIVGLWRPSTGP